MSLLAVTFAWWLLVLPLCAVPFLGHPQRVLQHGWLTLVPRDRLSPWLDRARKLIAAALLVCVVLGLAGLHRPQYPVERIISGRLVPAAAAQWILPCPDGSMRVIAADGCLLDQFNYGAELTGLATVEHSGRTMLAVSSTEGLQAWLVE